MAVPAPAQQPAGACRATEEFSDLDISLNSAALASAQLCLEQRTFAENGRDWGLTLVRNIFRQGPLWVVPHDDEDAGFLAGLYAVEHYGGALVAVETGEQRLNEGVDPNQIFALTPQAAEICPGAAEPAPHYVAAILAERNPAFPVVGLHSNWDGYLEAGGLGSISVLRQDSKMIPFPSASANGRFADEDTVVMLVGTGALERNTQTQAARDWFNAHGAHVIYRLVSADNNECTLADFLALSGVAPYYNLEVEHADAATLVSLTDLLMAFQEESEAPPD